MGRTDRYILSQLLTMFGFFGLVLIAVYWINRAVKLFDQLIGDGHSAMIFVEFSVLWLPAVIAQIFPLAAFAATVYVINRLSGDSELTVMQATGSSAVRLIRPVVVFGIITLLLMSLLTHFLVPMSKGRLAMRETQLSQNITARLLTEGQFLHPAAGVSFFIKRITPDGVLEQVFLSDTREPERSSTYSSKSAYLIPGETGSKMIMIDGVAQTFSAKNKRLSVTQFADLTYDLGDIIKVDTDHIPAAAHLTTPKMRHFDEVIAATGVSRGWLADKFHTRFHMPLLCLVAALIGYSTLMAGGFSRFGIGSWIVLAIFYLIVVQIVQGAVTDPVRQNANLWPLVYLPALVGLMIAGAMLMIAQGFFRGLRRRQRSVPA